MQSFIWLRGMSSEKVRVYESITIKPYDNDYTASDMTDAEIRWFKDNIHRFNKVVENSDGVVYEFNEATSLKAICGKLKICA